MGPFWPPRWPWDGRDGSTGTQNTSTQCAWVVRIHIMCLGPLRDLYGTPRAPKRARFGPFGGPGGPWAAPGGLIWAQVPLVGPTGWAASISCARAPLETTTALLGPPKGPVLAQIGPFGGPGGPWAAPGGLIWAQVPLVGPTGWAASISCARAPYETTTALLGPPKGPVLAQKGPFGSPGGPWAALGGLIWAQLPLVGPTGWATWL